jgi:hypothetical protein
LISTFFIGLLIDWKTSIYLTVRLKALASVKNFVCVRSVFA